MVEDGMRAAVSPLRSHREAEPARERYQRDPVGWIVDRLGVPEHTIRWSLNPGYRSRTRPHQWDGDRDPLVQALEALARWQNVGVEAATGTQKTYVLGACAVLWFLAVFEDAIVVTAAPKEGQLKLHLWKEISRLWPAFKARYPEAELSELRIRMRPRLDTWGAVGFPVGVGASEESATRAQGFHAEHLLIITEETPGINGAIMTAFENTCTAPHNLRLALGNPDHQFDELHKFAHAPGVVPVRISALDHPNVVADDPSIVPGAVSRQKIEERRAKYGEESPLFLSRVRGLAPAEATDALIRMAWCFVARDRTTADRAALRAMGPAALGADVANSENGDRAAVARGQGAELLEVPTFPCPDANAFGRIHLAPEIGPRLSADRVGVDVVGVGAGTVNELARLKHRVQALNGGAAPVDLGEQSEDFANLRSQMWWQMRVDLQHGRIALPDDEELFADLTTPRWGTRGGKIVVESKEDFKKRLRRSPDKGDAAVYWNWVREERAVIRRAAPPPPSESYVTI